MNGCLHNNVNSLLLTLFSISTLVQSEGPKVNLVMQVHKSLLQVLVEMQFNGNSGKRSLAKLVHYFPSEVFLSQWNHWVVRSSRTHVFCRMTLDFTNSQKIFLLMLLRKKLHCSCFPRNFVKCFITTFSLKSSSRLFRSGIGSTQRTTLNLCMVGGWKKTILPGYVKLS